MKKILITTLLTFIFNTGNAQVPFFSEDSMNNASNPGKYFIDYLMQEVNQVDRYPFHQPLTPSDYRLI